MKIKGVHLKHGRWYLVRRNQWHPLTRESEGDAALHAALAKLLDAPQQRIGDMSALLDDWSKVHFPEVAATTRKEYVRQLEIVRAGFIEFDAAEVAPGDVDTFCQQFSGTPNARRKYRTFLSTFFSWCVLRSRQTGVTVNPCRELRYRGPAKRAGRMTDALFWRLDGVLPPMARCAWWLMYLTAQRPTEIRLLRESQIRDGFVHFEPTKTAKRTGLAVSIRITPDIQRWLDEARSIRTRRGVVTLRDAPIIEAPDGGIYRPDAFSKLMRRACERAGIDGIDWRAVRPYALSALRKAGYQLQDIQQVAAHATAGMTEHYLAQHRDTVSTVAVPLPGKS